MITESELLDTFDIDVLDDTKYLCRIVLFSSATGYLRGLTDYLTEEGHNPLSSINVKGQPEVIVELTVNEMLILAARWSCIKEMRRETI